MTTTTYTQADVEAYERKLYNTSVTSLTLPNGITVQLGTLAERLQFLKYMKHQVAAATATGGSRTRFASTSKGV